MKRMNVAAGATINNMFVFAVVRGSGCYSIIIGHSSHLIKEKQVKGRMMQCK
jgi:hypothetical protein